MIRAIGRTGRVVDAADEMGLTPSALSHRIKEAERRLGVPLFERMHKRLRMIPCNPEEIDAMTKFAAATEEQQVWQSPAYFLRGIRTSTVE